MHSTARMARCLLRRHRRYANAHLLYSGMGWGAWLHRETRAWYLWRVAHSRAPAHVRAVALVLHARMR